MRPLPALAAAALLCLAAAPAQSALTLFKNYVGNLGLSTDGAGSTSSTNTISAFVPAGATVVEAFLYQANNGSPTNQVVSLNGNALTFSPAVLNATACCDLSSSRADVTSLLAPIINAGPGGTYNFTVTEGSTVRTDGTALYVVYSLDTLPLTTIGILDGFASVAGDTATISFAEPLNPSAPGFAAEMRLGISFSCGGTTCGGDQKSTIRVNGALVTENAGNFDDGLSLANGSLITVGGSDDPFSPLLPSYAADRERYNLVPFISSGSSSITIDTANASSDDNIFLAAFLVTGRGQVSTGPAIPEPSTWAMMLLGFGAVGYGLRRRRELPVARA
jgi:hypothetical protein